MREALQFQSRSCQPAVFNDLKVQVNVVDQCMVVTSECMYNNPNDELVHATFTVPVHESASVCAFSVVFHDNTEIVGTFHESKVAQEKHDTAIRNGQSSAILKRTVENTRDRFQIDIGNVRGKSRCLIRTVYMQHLDMESDRTMKVIIPLNAGYRFQTRQQAFESRPKNNNVWSSPSGSDCPVCGCDKDDVDHTDCHAEIKNMGIVSDSSKNDKLEKMQAMERKKKTEDDDSVESVLKPFMEMWTHVLRKDRKMKLSMCNVTDTIHIQLNASMVQGIESVTSPSHSGRLVQTYTSTNVVQTEIKLDSSSSSSKDDHVSFLLKRREQPEGVPEHENIVMVERSLPSIQDLSDDMKTKTSLHEGKEEGKDEEKKEKKDNTNVGDVVQLTFVMPELSTITTDVCQTQIIVVDESGSMRECVRDVKECVQYIIGSMTPITYFNIVSFGDGFRSLFPDGPRLFTRETMELAENYVKQKIGSDMGGTEIVPPITYILQQKVPVTHPRQVFLITDGQVNTTKQIVNMVRCHADTTRFFTFGIGNVSSELISDVAEASHGRYEFITSGDDIKSKVMKHVVAATQPALVRAEVQSFDLFGKDKVIVWSPAVLPVLFSGSSYTLYGRRSTPSSERSMTKNGGSARLVLRGRPSGVLKEEEEQDGFISVDIPFVVRESFGGLPDDTLHRLFASTRIAQLESSRKYGGNVLRYEAGETKWPMAHPKHANKGHVFERSNYSPYKLSPNSTGWNCDHCNTSFANGSPNEGPCFHCMAPECGYDLCAACWSNEAPEIIRLSIEYGVLSSLTSLVAIHPDKHVATTTTQSTGGDESTNESLFEPSSTTMVKKGKKGAPSLPSFSFGGSSVVGPSPPSSLASLSRGTSSSSWSVGGYRSMSLSGGAPPSPPLPPNSSLFGSGSGNSSGSGLSKPSLKRKSTGTTSTGRAYKVYEVYEQDELEEDDDDYEKEEKKEKKENKESDKEKKINDGGREKRTKILTRLSVSEHLMETLDKFQGTWAWSDELMHFAANECKKYKIEMTIPWATDINKVMSVVHKLDEMTRRVMGTEMALFVLQFILKEVPPKSSWTLIIKKAKTFIRASPPVSLV